MAGDKPPGFGADFSWAEEAVLRMDSIAEVEGFMTTIWQGEKKARYIFSGEPWLGSLGGVARLPEHLSSRPRWGGRGLGESWLRSNWANQTGTTTGRISPAVPDRFWFDEAAQFAEPKLSDLAEAVRWFLVDEARR